MKCGRAMKIQLSEYEIKQVVLQYLQNSLGYVGEGISTDDMKFEDSMEIVPVDFPLVLKVDNVN